jgi:hypothetical protein
MGNIVRKAAMVVKLTMVIKTTMGAKIPRVTDNHGLG